MRNEPILQDMDSYLEILMLMWFSGRLSIKKIRIDKYKMQVISTNPVAEITCSSMKRTIIASCIPPNGNTKQNIAQLAVSCRQQNAKDQYMAALIRRS